MFTCRKQITRHFFLNRSIKSLIICLRKMSNKKILCLFDVDGTLTAPRNDITSDMQDFLLNQVKPKVALALVGGSDYNKICEQMNGTEVLDQFYAVFSENGLIAHQKGEEVSRQCIQDYVGEDKLQKFINYALHYMSKLTLPLKRGTFIEFRTGLVNVCPVGRSCSQAERDQFDLYDRENKVRQKFVDTLRREFPDLGLVYSIGGQISFDVFPEGWDKTYCLRHIPEQEFSEIHFFGDKTEPGGNDHEIFNHPRVIGHRVTSPEDTRQQLNQLINS